MANQYGRRVSHTRSCRLAIEALEERRALSAVAGEHDELSSLSATESNTDTFVLVRSEGPTELTLIQADREDSAEGEFPWDRFTSTNSNQSPLELWLRSLLTSSSARPNVNILYNPSFGSDWLWRVVAAIYQSRTQPPAPTSPEPGESQPEPVSEPVTPPRASLPEEPVEKQPSAPSEPPPQETSKPNSPATPPTPPRNPRLAGPVPASSAAPVTEPPRPATVEVPPAQASQPEAATPAPDPAPAPTGSNTGAEQTEVAEVVPVLPSVATPAPGADREPDPDPAPEPDRPERTDRVENSRATALNPITGVSTRAEEPLFSSYPGSSPRSDLSAALALGEATVLMPLSSGTGAASLLDLGDLAPEGTDVLAVAAPVDRATLEAALEQFLRQLGEMGDDLNQVANGGWGLIPWLAAVAVAATAYEVSRRHHAKQGSVAGADEATERLHFSWLTGLPGPLLAEAP